MERRESTGPGQWERREMAGDTRAEVRARPSNPSLTLITQAMLLRV